MKTLAMHFLRISEQRARQAGTNLFFLSLLMSTGIVEGFEKREGMKKKINTVQEIVISDF